MNEKNTTPKRDERVRNVTFVLYEDSAPKDWQERLNNEHIPYLYVYHDKDLNPTGEPKKPHFHILLLFEGKKSKEQLQEIVSRIGAANGTYQPVNSIRSMARYLCHLDNPDKAQYDISSVVSSAVDYLSIIDLPSDKYTTINEMIQFCEEENIVSMRELINYSRLHKFSWFKVLCDSGAFVMKEYMKSKLWEQNNMRIDDSTGEVLK